MGVVSRRKTRIMPGKLVIGVVADLCRKDLGIYECPMCTVFGIEREEAKALMDLCGAGLKFTDRNKEAEGFEVNTSAFKIMRELGRHLGYEPLGDCHATEKSAKGERTVVWTL